jgi:hypothetical protein
MRVCLNFLSLAFVPALAFAQTIRGKVVERELRRAADLDA